MGRMQLYGMTHSLYSGKARSWLIKNGVPFEEISAGDPQFHAKVLPQLGRWIIPVLATPGGELVQDGAAIIDWGIANGLERYPTLPASPRQRLVSRIMELFGGEGLLRPAMHYRWNFDADNKAFIENQFGLFAMPHKAPEERAAIISKSTGRMRKAAENFGVTAATIPAIEAAYLDLLAALDAHFSRWPYLLGGHPTLGDYGLIAPLFAHLGRDPHPARLMQQRAPALYRWTERMNAAGPDMPEFMDRREVLVADDAIPDTLRAILRLVARDYLPEVRAFVAAQDAWTDAQPDLQDGDPVGGEPLRRGIGFCTFPWQGHELQVVVMPYRSWLLQRIHSAFDDLSEAEGKAVRSLLDDLGLADLLDLRPKRRVERRDNREVWGAVQD